MNAENTLQNHPPEEFLLDEKVDPPSKADPAKEQQVSLASQEVDSDSVQQDEFQTISTVKTEEHKVPQVTLDVIPIDVNGINTVCETFEQSVTNPTCAASSQTTFLDTSKRETFIRIVYGIVSAQLLTITGVISVALLGSSSSSNKESLIFTQWALYSVPILPVSIISCGVGSCLGTKKSSGQIVYLVVNTLMLGIVLAILSVHQSDKTILLSVAITAAVCAFLAIFGTRLTTWEGVFGVTTAIISIIFVLLILGNVLPVPRLTCASLAALAFSTFLVYDTRRVLNCKHGGIVSITCDECVFALYTFNMDLILILLVLSLLAIIGLVTRSILVLATGMADGDLKSEKAAGDLTSV